jgi:hypothetical protein
MKGRLSDADFDLLDALATYRILTIDQAVRLGVAKRWHVGERLRGLAKARLVKILESARMNGPRLHWLTASGAKVVEELAEEAGKPRKVEPPRADYKLGPHLRQRVAIVDCHIALRQWAAEHGAKVDWVRTEFDAHGEGLAKATALAWEGAAYEADALASVTTEDGTSWLVVLEVETGGEGARLDNFSKLLPSRLEAIENHLPEYALDWPQGAHVARLLFVFASVDMMERAKRVHVRPDSDAWERVHFNALPSVVEDFGKGWWQRGKSPLPF